MRLPTRLLLGFIGILCCTTATFASTTLTYSGSNLNAGAGTMTITCTDSTLGNLWSLQVQETSTFAVAFPQFEDLTDAGVGGVHFNYAGNNVRGGGAAAYLFNATKNGSATKVFTELTKTSSEYQCQVVETVTFSGPKVVPITDTYTISPSATTGTNLISCTSTFTNNSSPQRALTLAETGSMMAFECWMNCSPWGGNGSSPTGEFSAYATTGTATGSRTMVKTSDGVTPTIFQVWDNFNKTSPLYVAPPSYPSDNPNTFASTTEVLNNTITSGLGITAGRTFTYNVDMAYTNVADSSNHNDGYANCLLDTTAAYPDVDYRVGDSGNDWGYNHSGIAINQVITHTAALTVDLTNVSSGAPVSIPGADEAVMDTNGTGNINVTLNGSASTGTITSWAWYLNGSSTAIATTENPTVSLPIGIDDMELTVSGPGGNSSAVQRVWIYPTPTYWVDGLNGNDSNNGTSQATAFKTINTGTQNAHLAGGNVVMVLGTTIYRGGSSTNTFVVSTTNSGTSGNNITAMGMPLQRVIIDGSDLVTGWTQCPSTLNSNYLKIWYSTITRSQGPPVQVTQTENGVETELVASGLPTNTAGGPPYNGGRNVVTGGTQGSVGPPLVYGTIVDSTNLAGKYSNNYFNGASLNYSDETNTFLTYGSLSVVAYNNTSGTLTVASSVSNTVLSDTPVAGQDAYCIYNMPQLLNAPGQFAVVSNGGTSYTLYVWLTDSSNPGNTGNQVAANGNRTVGISPGTRSYWTFDNFEVRHINGSQHFGGGVGIGYNPAGPGMTYRNCLVYLCEGNGIASQSSAAGVITHCTAEYCRYPIVANVTNVTNDVVSIDHCEAAHSWEDGIRPCGANTNNNNTMTTDSCYVHDILGYNHSDGMQVVGAPGYLTTLNIQNCLEFNELDFFQTSMNPGYINTFNCTNNVWIGGGYSELGTGGNTGPSHGALFVENNTIAGSAAGAVDWMNFSPTGTFENNVVFEGQAQRKCLYVSGTSYTADYNDWFMYSGQTDTPVNGPSENGTNTSGQYQTLVSPQDSHSYGNQSNGNPLFTNFPAECIGTNTVVEWANTPTTVNVGTTGIVYAAVNDHIEIDWDGVMRQVTAVNTTTGLITFTPAKNNIATYPTGAVYDFGTITNPTYNLAFQSGSPAIGHNSTGGNMGSSLNIANWTNCDFNGDGRRDIPAYPPTMALPPG